MAPGSTSRKLSISKKQLICSEILSVTTAMRKNSRWSSASQVPLYARDEALAASLGLRRADGPSSSVSGTPLMRQDVQLMVGFLELKREVQVTDDIDSIPLSALLSPFFALIRSPLSTGPITSAALASLHAFFVADLIEPTAPDIDQVLAELSSTVAHCKFDASDASGDEVVVYRIMNVIERCMCGRVGRRIGDIEVCEMLETVLTTCCQMRLSEILRRYAESTMHAIVREIFGRLHELNPETEEAKLTENDPESDDNELRMKVQTGPALEPPAPETSPSRPATPTLENPAPIERELQVPEQAEQEPEILSTPIRAEYGLPSVLELLRVLVNILDPDDRLHTDSTRLTALRVLNTAFEMSGTVIRAYPSLMALIQDHGCKYLFQLARSTNPNVLQMALRVVATMLETMRPKLKLQQELFLAFTIDKLAPAVPTRAQVAVLAQQRGLTASPRPGGSSPGTPVPGTPVTIEEEESVGPSKPALSPAKGETRELMLETLSLISRYPTFMVDLFVNYDCDVNCEDLFERLVDFLTKGVYGSPTRPRDASQQASQLLCLELLLDLIKYMTERATSHTGLNTSFPYSPQALLESKSRKRLVMTAASRFNTKPKVGLSFLEENKLIYADVTDPADRPKSLAQFLKTCGRLDKRVLGDFISRPENLDVLKAFISLFDFKNKPVAEALRELLESFRLPGESQQIARITETFAEVYFASEPADIRSQDAVYVLTYSVIMLNTDLHNPQVRKRMTLEDYRKNLRGVNDGSDFPEEFLFNVYESIRKREIVMPEEHTGHVGFGYAWKELLSRSRQVGDFEICESSIFDRSMFTAAWKSIIASIAYVFTTFDDDYTVQRSITGFRQLATLAGHFNLPEVLDYVVVALSQVSSLVPDTLLTRVPHYPIIEVDGQDITVSTLSVKFGTQFKGQLAAVVLFTIVNGNGNAVREGWTQIFEIFQNLFMNSLLPEPLLKLEDFLSGGTIIPLHSASPDNRPAGRSDGGLLSALSSYLMTPYSSAEIIPEATDSEAESTMCTIDCLSACKLDVFYSQITALNCDTLVWAVRALEALAHERTVARLKQESDDSLPPGSPNPGRKAPASSTVLSYDPAAMYLLETMVSVICKTPQYIEETWPVAYEHLSSLIASSSNYNILLIERAIAGIWRLLLIIADKPSLRDQLYLSLDLLRGLPPAIINSVGEQVMNGVEQLVKQHPDIIRSQTEWNLVFSLMGSSMRQPTAARRSVDILSALITDANGNEPRVSTDNFSSLLAVLDDLASQANTAVQTAGRQDRRKPLETPVFELVLERGKQSIDLLFEMKKFIPKFVQEGRVPPVQIWETYSLPFISVLAKHTTSAAKEVRSAALLDLQRVLLGQQVLVPGVDKQVDDIFNHILFPLLESLTDPEANVRSMLDTCTLASVLLCKTFMHFEVNDAAKEKDLRPKWIHVLDLLERALKLDRRHLGNENVLETLKNVILVMHAIGILVRGDAAGITSSTTQKELWAASHERLEKFLPGFLDEIVPPSPQPAAAPPPAVSPTGPPSMAGVAANIEKSPAAAAAAP